MAVQLSAFSREMLSICLFTRLLLFVFCFVLSSEALIEINSSVINIAPTLILPATLDLLEGQLVDIAPITLEDLDADDYFFSRISANLTCGGGGYGLGRLIFAQSQLNGVSIIRGSYGGDSSYEILGPLANIQLALSSLQYQFIMSPNNWPDKENPNSILINDVISISVSDLHLQMGNYVYDHTPLVRTIAPLFNYCLTPLLLALFRNQTMRVMRR